MGANFSSCASCQGGGREHLREKFNVQPMSDVDFVIALAGNPNVGKTTIFNALTGLRQHTGNWPGKTVTQAQGIFQYNEHKFVIVDLPGTYSLLANSMDEEVARDFLCFGRPHVTVVVVDATCLERNLNLVLQILEITSKVIVCVNLLDEAERKGLSIDMKALAEELGVPVIGTSARTGEGLGKLKELICQMSLGKVVTCPRRVNYDEQVLAAANELIPLLEPVLQGRLDAFWVALRLLDGDKTIIKSIENHLRLVDVAPVKSEVVACLD